MLRILPVLFGIAVILLAAEYLWRHKRKHSEVTRKLVHMSVAAFAATWPWYLTESQIIVISVLLLIGITLSVWLNVFRSIHSIDRNTWGEILFAVAIGLTALLAQSKLIYATALLHLGLADGIAAVVGVRYGRASQYKIFGHTKSVIGSMACMAVSLAILSAYLLLTNNQSVLYVALPLALIVTLIENIAIRGLDNIFVPLAVVLLLNATL